VDVSGGRRDQASYLRFFGKATPSAAQCREALEVRRLAGACVDLPAARQCYDRRTRNGSCRRTASRWRSRRNHEQSKEIQMQYVDGYVLPVPKKNLKAYLRMARIGEKAWRKHGALDYKECVGDDLKTKWAMPFPRMMKLKADETVVFAFIVFKSRAHRDRVNAKVMQEMANAGAPKDMPFDMQRMVYGGFKASVGG
jgi:uncharacterized protein YbaA (DUF1428 family)